MGNLKVVIETPKGYREKFNYDPETGFFLLKKVLPEGMVFPYDFGFIPGTKGEDGDPLDILIISEYKTFPGCLIECRLVGCIEAYQKEKDKSQKIKNDRFVAVPLASVAYAEVKNIRQLPGKILNQLESFFINYNGLENKIFKVEKISGPERSVKLIAANKT